MIATLIAYTQLTGELEIVDDESLVVAAGSGEAIVEAFRSSPTLEQWLPAYPEDAHEPTDGDLLAEFAGRACYQSWDRPNAKTATNEAYLGNIINIGHESVLSHASATFYITGVSRSLTHELVRHRWMSFSQLSQRYVDQSTVNVVVPPVLRSAANSDLHTLLDEHAKRSREVYQQIADALVDRGSSRKEARGAARAVLPEATATEIVVSTNYRGWRDFLKQRLSSAADQEIRELAEEIRDQLLEVAPHTFQDLAPAREES